MYVYVMLLCDAPKGDHNYQFLGIHILCIHVHGSQVSKVFALAGVCNVESYVLSAK